MSRMGLGEELASELLRSGGWLRMKARGGSMVPFIWDGDLLLVSPAESSAIRVGDVICYQTLPGQLFLHRVIMRDGERLVTKGDALACTELIGPGHVLGKVVAIERRGRSRRLDTGIARWRNRMIVFLSPCLPKLLPLAIWLRRIWRAASRG